MPEPDFGQMARSTTGFIRVDPEAREALELNIIDLLRLIWNARGAADAKAVEHAVLYADIKDMEGRQITDTVILPMAKLSWNAVKDLDR